MELLKPQNPETLQLAEKTNLEPGGVPIFDYRTARTSAPRLRESSRRYNNSSRHCISTSPGAVHPDVVPTRTWTDAEFSRPKAPQPKSMGGPEVLRSDR